MDFFNTKVCFGKFLEQQKKFWDAEILKKSLKITF